MSIGSEIYPFDSKVAHVKKNKINTEILANTTSNKALSEKNPEPNPINMSFVINPKNIENTAKIINMAIRFII
jgi:hypothetical protein